MNILTSVFRVSLCVALSTCGFASSLHAQTPARPNVIIVMADDQGYGDIKAHGHPLIRTPNMDRLHAESVRFTDFHVAPMCTPTRSQLLTGVDAMKNGATAVCQGRSMIRREIPTLANYFSDAGYRTILSGKWHLGDSYPHRPQDRGFQEVLSFRAWGLPSLASHWDNSTINEDIDTNAYVNPTLEHNGIDKKYAGYVTDILFDHAMEQISESKAAGTPFFLYLPTPTPHTPNIAPKEKYHYYKDQQTIRKLDGTASAYFGMIENIDDNLGRLEAQLEAKGLRENTILVYLSDNGTQSRHAEAIYNAGMRGRKRTMWDGGHRVPLFVRWEQGGLQHGRDVNELTQVQDLLPTLLNLCEVKPANLYPQDGVDLSPLLQGQAWPHGDRILVAQYNTSGKLWDWCVTMKGPWRLVDHKLYNIHDDPHQDTDLSQEHPEVLQELKTAYEDWHAIAHKEFLKPRIIDLGHPEAPSTILYASDWEGGYCDNEYGLKQSDKQGVWHVDVIEPGTYRIELSRWPFESGKALTESLYVANPPQWAKKDDQWKTLGARPIAKASLQLGAVQTEKVTQPDDQTVVFEVSLPAGKQRLKTLFYDAEENALCSANYVRVTQL